ncbi:MAG: helix-turn-helix domain-containing protein [Candidatus Thalassarchaeum sp.]|jgi:DNA-binding HxlR family transcriptional regulator|nr:helix-turn-helix domain-containing protein [Candidatus Thalassarchaeum sp.]
MAISDEDYKRVETAITEVKENGVDIRSIFESYYDNENFDIDWEVDAAVDAFSIFSSRWTIEILATLYIAGERRFNEMRKLLRGISSRTLSDKLTKCAESGLIDRIVEDGPPIRVKYRLTDHGRDAGRLLSPLVAYMKIRQGRVARHSI